MDPLPAFLPLSLSEVLFPLFSLGTLGTGLFAFTLLAWDRREKRVYWGVLLLLIVSFLATACDTAVLVLGGIAQNVPAALQFSRLHEVATTLFIVAIPLSIWSILPSDSNSATIMRSLSIAGGVVVLIIVVTAFIAPDLFVSTTTQRSSNRIGIAYSSSLGRGEEGLLFMLRDLILGLVLFVSLGVSIVATVVKEISGSFRLVVIGIGLGILIGSTALIANFTGSYPGPLDGIPFSRVGLSITVFTLFATAAYVLRYVQQSKMLDETNRELKHRRDRLTFLAYHNDLTQMPNKQAFIRDIAGFLSRSESCETYLCDIDGFRQLQDSFGFQLSERLLRTIGKRVEHVAARWGGAQAMAYHLDGDGFAVLLPQQLNDDRPRFEDDFIRAITDPIVIDDQEILVSTAVGHYTLNQGDTAVHRSAAVPTDAEAVLQRLRRTVASAKGFHNAICRYSSEVHDAVEATQELVQEMRHAVRNRSFRIEYQPILDRTGSVVAAEALIRWDNAPPSVFIPLAEQSGLIVPITEFVVEQVAKDTAELREMLPEIEVHINISARHIVQLQILELLTRSLAHHGVPHSAIGLEITETSFVHGGSTFTAILESLRAAGFGVAIDDFGTGYSSLSYLKQIPADRIKIDQSFVAGLPVSNEDGALVESVITLGRRLGKTIVAEGIESDLQHRYLVDQGVDFLQGFFFSRSVPVDRFVDTARARSWHTE